MSMTRSNCFTGFISNDETPSSTAYWEKNQRRYCLSGVMLHSGGTESHPCRKIRGTESHRCRVVQNIRGAVFHELIVMDFFLRTDVLVGDLTLHLKIMGGQKIKPTHACMCSPYSVATSV